MFNLRLKAFLHRLTGRHSVPVKQHFTKIYTENLFRGDESRSGAGSSIAQTAQVRRDLPLVLERWAINRFLDAPCGDCNWIMELDWSRVAYTGVDVVAGIIKANRERFSARSVQFMVADLCRDPLPKADLIFCRDCWVHLSFDQIRACLVNFRRSGSKYLMTTTFSNRTKNEDLSGLIWRPLNLRAAPFCFPPPKEMLVEGCTENGGAFADKALGLWELDDLNS